MTWLEIAKSLAPGRSLRVSHCNPSDKSAVTSAGEHGWSLYCFRCGGTVEFEPYPELSLQDKLNKLNQARQADEYHEYATTLPQPVEFSLSKWPITHRVWLHKAGLTNDDIAMLGIYYNSKTDRVVLPVMRGERVVYWQARGFDTSRAKYINPSIADPPAAKFGEGSSIVLTEDYLSAFRVGQHTEAWALLGTALKPGVLSELLPYQGTIKIWLDPDFAGQSKGRDAARLLRTYGKSVVMLHSDRDPKLLSSSEIKDILCAD